MINTCAFKTKTEMAEKRLCDAGGAWPVGIDVGYSGVKVMSPNAVLCFPSFAREAQGDGEPMGRPCRSDIRYRDEAGKTWLVGELAYSDLGPMDVAESERELYGRQRYYSPIFTVIARTGLALGCSANACGSPEGRRIVVQTGLPPKYLTGDAAFLKDVLAGRHRFSLDVGGGGWTEYDLEIDPGDIQVMSQPKGALLSAAIGPDGRFAPGAGRLLRSNVVIADTGFGTFDIFSIHSGSLDNQETFPGLGMREVFRRTCADILREFGTEVSVPYMQNCLRKGRVMAVDPRNRSRKECDFSAMLEKNCLDVCRESAEKILLLNGYCADTDCIIPAGGAYDAWKDEFDRQFASMEGLRIMPGNVNAYPLSNVYSNVRGYFYNLAARGGK